MATKKTARKSAKKKTATKKVAKRKYTRRTPAAEKPKPKRKYTRRAKPEEQQSVSLAALAGREISPSVEEQVNEQPSTSEILTQIDVIDLRGSDVVNRFSIFHLLSEEGYIVKDNLDGPLSPRNLPVFLFYDAILMEHQNKLITFMEASDIKSDMAVSKTQVEFQTRVGFSRPEPAYEDVLQVGNATYVRIAP